MTTRITTEAALNSTDKPASLQGSADSHGTTDTSRFRQRGVMHNDAGYQRPNVGELRQCPTLFVELLGRTAWNL